MSRVSGPTIPHTGLSRSAPVALKAGTLVATSIVVTPATKTISDGTTTQLAAVVLDQRGHPLATQPTISWGSSDEAKATVDSSGLVTSVAAGSATITATAGLLSDTCVVTVQTPVVTSITITPAGFTIDDDETQELTGEVIDQNDVAMAGEVINWSSDDTGVATVDSSGVVTAVGPGVVTITAESDTDPGVTADVVGGIRATASYDDLVDDFPGSSLDAKWTDASAGSSTVTVASGKATFAGDAGVAAIASAARLWPDDGAFVAWTLGTVTLSTADTLACAFAGIPPVGGDPAVASVTITKTAEGYDVATSIGIQGDESEKLFENEAIAAWTWVQLVRYQALRTVRWRLYSSEDGRHWTLRDQVQDADAWDAFRLSGSTLTITLTPDSTNTPTAEVLSVGVIA